MAENIAGNKPVTLIKRETHGGDAKPMGEKEEPKEEKTYLVLRRSRRSSFGSSERSSQH